MILKASERGNSAWLGRHLLNVEHNEHLEVHDIRGFVAQDIMGAMKEAQAMSYGTRCKNYLFSLSMNPPENEIVRPEVFERATAAIEERLNLTGHARIMVFHEKEGRRHCHAVWSRIDPATMTARNLPHFKNKLCEISREQYLEHGWKMPPGLARTKDRDPRNFTLHEWQQARRAGLNARDAKGYVQDSWAISDNAQSFAKAMEERGFYIARGDRRGYVAVSYEGEVFSIPKMIGIHTSQVKARLGDSEKLRSLADTYKHIGETIKPKVSEHIRQAKAKAAADMSPLEQQRQAMKAKHEQERQRLDAGQKARQEAETKDRADRIRKGLLGLWDKLTGEHAKLVKQGQMEAFFTQQRDREQRQGLLAAQMKDRQDLQAQMRLKREGHAKEVLSLYRDAANVRQMQRGEPPAKPSAAQKLESLWDKRLREGRDLKAEIQGRERRDRPRETGPDLER